MKISERTKIKRIPDRGVYYQGSIYRILDNHFLCHAGFIHHGFPVVIPTLYGRAGDFLFIHGASVSRLITELEQGIDLCISVASVNGLVLARSAFHHSMNYESVVIFGKGELVPENEKESALRTISEHIIPGRWEEVRKPNRKELKATKVIRIAIREASAKIRTGGTKDEMADMNLDVWAGVLPFVQSVMAPAPDASLKGNIDIPISLLNKMKPSAGFKP